MLESTDGGVIISSMTNTYSWYKSGAVWSFIIMFIVGGVQAVSGSINPSLLTFIMAVLGLAGAYFHVSVAKLAGATN